MREKIRIFCFNRPGAYSSYTWTQEAVIGTPMPNKRDLIPFFAMLGVALLCYGSIIPTYFLSDDFELIAGIIRHGMSYTWGLSVPFFRPGTTLSYLFDHQLWGLNAVGYHLTNIVFHGLSAYALFLIARHYFTKLGVDRPLVASSLAAMLFVALPSHSESVSWIAGRTDVIAIALGLTGTALFLSMLEDRSLFRAILSLLLLAAALVTKESVITLPFVWGGMYVYHWYSKRERPAILASVILLSSLLLLSAYFLVRKAALGTFIGGYGTTFHTSGDTPSISNNLSKYLFRTFLPPLPLSLSGARLIAVLAAGLLLLAFSRQWKRFRTVRWSLVWLLALCYLLSLAPVITMYVNIYDTQGERFLYLPSAFACMLLVYVVWAGLPQTRFRTVALLAVVVVQAGLLQWVNTRWITASHLTEEIAAEVARTDPANTAILNIPDNFRGAYVFRHGLDDATTLFLGREGRAPFPKLLLHDVHASRDVFEARLESTAVVVTLPDNIRSEVGWQLKRTQSVVLLDTLEAYPGAVSFLSFRSASTHPMMQEVRWRGTPNLPGSRANGD